MTSLQEPLDGMTAAPTNAADGRDAEREPYRERLRALLPELRQIEGFPNGRDEDILALSDAPLYTACPNPFLKEFIEQHAMPFDEATDTYHREPFAVDVSEGKNDPTYNAHSYHTKVPHKAIVRYILHYTEPGDLVFDGFCGTGMTGVAAQHCGDRRTVEALGYSVTDDGTVVDANGERVSRFGPRRTILNDLSPAATFIAYNYNAPSDSATFSRVARNALTEVEAECGWMYVTLHRATAEQLEEAKADLHRAPRQAGKLPGVIWGRINYTVWSDVFVCSACGQEVVFWAAAVDKVQGKVLNVFKCGHCQAEMTKRRLERAWITVFDTAINDTVRQAKQVPVLINYSIGSLRYEKTPDSFDLALLSEISSTAIPHWFPSIRMPEGDESRRNDGIGITYTHHFYTHRGLHLIASLVAHSSSPAILMAILDGQSVGTRMSRFRVPLWIDKTSGPMKGLTAGTLYIPSLVGEQNWLNILREKVAMIQRAVWSHGETAISTGDAAHIQANPEVIDYIFTDPPFGDNLMYSELNFLSESWLSVFTNAGREAVVNRSQHKGLAEYERLMVLAFREFYRLLKPGRWMTVEFHNSKNSVWNAIQLALEQAGFIVADVRTLNKEQGSFKQVNSAGAVKQDLVISSYKPRHSFAARFAREAGTPEGAWDFVRQHLAQLPTFVGESGKVTVNAERQHYLLFDRMVAFHIQRGATVPLSASEFYAGLQQRFSERDGMYFLPEQVAAYDQKRAQAPDVEQFALFVDGERTAVQWLRQQLESRPLTYQEIYPQFQPQLHQAAHEQVPELMDLLRQNFLKDERDRWYVPDPNRQSDLEKLRERGLLQEFQTYAASRGKLKTFRSEAVRAGFSAAWRSRDYTTIVRVAQRLPEAVLQDDPQLLMYFDNASARVEE